MIISAWNQLIFLWTSLGKLPNIHDDNSFSSLPNKRSFIFPLIDKCMFHCKICLNETDKWHVIYLKIFMHNICDYFVLFWRKLWNIKCLSFAYKKLLCAYEGNHIWVMKICQGVAFFPIFWIAWPNFKIILKVKK